MMRSKELLDFLETQPVSDEVKEAIKARLTTVVITNGLLAGCFSDCDTEFVLGDTKLEEEFTLFHDQKYGFAPEKLPD